MHDRDERLSRFRRELLVAAARVRQELQPGRSLNRTICKSIAQAIEHWADTVDTIDDKQIAEFDAAASGIGDDELASVCIKPLSRAGKAARQERLRSSLGS
jgi:hypothetical protein